MLTDQFTAEFRKAVQDGHIERACAMLLKSDGTPSAGSLLLTSKDLAALGLSHPPGARSAWLRSYALSHPEALKIIPVMLQLLPPAKEEPLERFRLYKAMARQFGHRQMASAGWTPPEDIYTVAQELHDPQDALLALVMLVRILASRDGSITPEWSRRIAHSGVRLFNALGKEPETLAWYIAHPELRLVDKIDVVERICTVISEGGDALALGRLLLHQNARFNLWGSGVRQKLWALCVPRLTAAEAATLVDLAYATETSVPDVLAEHAMKHPRLQTPEGFIRTATIHRWHLEPEKVALSIH